MFCYPHALEISYDTDNEYRECLVKIIQSYDNWQPFMTEIFSWTRNNPHMCALYEKAALKHFFVTNQESGIMILMSFDYLVQFHKCLQEFCKVEEPQNINLSIAYQDLLDKINA